MKRRDTSVVRDTRDANGRSRAPAQVTGAASTSLRVQQVLGHASIETTQRYARLSDEAVMSEASRIRAL